MNKLFKLLILCFITNSALSQSILTESTPSQSEYFSWINNTNEGTTEEQTLINLDFFKWLKTEYGMDLDIYAFDAGAIDGKRFYGSIKSDRFKKQFPHSFSNIYKKAKSMDTKLGIWGGPDGFGKSKKEEKARIEQMVSLCRDFEFDLFKFDNVCGSLPKSKEKSFIKMMEQCRKYSPNLILLNHRLGLSKEATKHTTTYLLGGRETYIDVFSYNDKTAPHHREGALSCPTIKGMKRLTEDHGVCISSALDFWDDDLILQAFNRNLILAPQIYGSPFFLSDNEFPMLARIFNLHKRYRNIMINGIELPKQNYGQYAVSRGDDNTKLITLRNLSWKDKYYTIELGAEIGLKNNRDVQLFSFFPYEENLGVHKYSDKIKIKVEPFRVALILATTNKYTQKIVNGIKYKIVRDVPNKSIKVNLFGERGKGYNIDIKNFTGIRKVLIDNKEVKIDKIKNSKFKIYFEGEKIDRKAQTLLSSFVPISTPNDYEALYEATVFSADNNALEVRSLYRSGATKIPQVKQARDAFFNQSAFINRGVWDKNLFDKNPSTAFWPSKKYNNDQKIKGGCFRLDLGEILDIDKIILYVQNEFALHPLLTDEGNYAEVSTDLINWETITYLAGTECKIEINKKVRYIRLSAQPSQITDIIALKNNKELNPDKWRANNLFAPARKMVPVKTWLSTFRIKRVIKNDYLSIAINGKHGIEGAYVAVKVDGKLLGCPDRSPSYQSNTWEYVNVRVESNYTYYFPLKKDYEGKSIEVYVFAYDDRNLKLVPKVWHSSNRNTLVSKMMEIFRK